MVRLKANRVKSSMLDEMTFQFQNGTIKSLLLKVNLTFPLKFQFQNGTIKSNMLDLTRLAVECFNSKMVRLKE